MTLVSRNVTNNQATFDTNNVKLLVFGNSFFSGTYKNITGGDESVSYGQLMGRVAATGFLVPCKSAAVDGSQFPVGIMLNALTDIATTVEVENVNLVNGGKVNEALLVFDGTDTLDTVVDTRTLRDLLITNSKDLELVSIVDDTALDN